MSDPIIAAIRRYLAASEPMWRDEYLDSMAAGIASEVRAEMPEPTGAHGLGTLDGYLKGHGDGYAATPTVNAEQVRADAERTATQVYPEDYHRHLRACWADAYEQGARAALGIEVRP